MKKKQQNTEKIKPNYNYKMHISETETINKKKFMV